MAKKSIEFQSGNLPDEEKNSIVQRIRTLSNRHVPVVTDEEFLFSDGTKISCIQAKDGAGWKQFRTSVLEKLWGNTDSVTLRMYMYSEARIDISKKNHGLTLSMGKYEFPAKLVSETDFGGLFLYTYEFSGKPKLWKERVVNFS